MPQVPDMCPQRVRRAGLRETATRRRQRRGRIGGEIRSDEDVGTLPERNRRRPSASVAAKCAYDEIRKILVLPRTKRRCARAGRAASRKQIDDRLLESLWDLGVVLHARERIRRRLVAWLPTGRRKSGRIARRFRLAAAAPMLTAAAWRLVRPATATDDGHPGLVALAIAGRFA